MQLTSAHHIALNLIKSHTYLARRLENVIFLADIYIPSYKLGILLLNDMSRPNFYYTRITGLSNINFMPISLVLSFFLTVYFSNKILSISQAPPFAWITLSFWLQAVNIYFF